MRVCFFSLTLFRPLQQAVVKSLLCAKCRVWSGEGTQSLARMVLHFSGGNQIRKQVRQGWDHGWHGWSPTQPRASWNTRRGPCLGAADGIHHGTLLL